jgi:protein-S-isoprenylcysteine O-methyltransferase Ste14
VRASELEFRHRFAIISAIFGAGFACYAFDREPLVVSIARALGGGGDGATRAALAVAAAFALAGAFLRTWGTAWLRTGVVKDRRVHADRVVADGPYRHVRNPLYLGTLLLGVGIGSVASPLGFLVIVAGLLVFFLRLIGREEAELSAARGSGYEAFRAAVPRLVPSLLPRCPRSGARPQWRQALVGELMAWCQLAAVASLAITLDPRWFYALIALSFLAYLPGRKLRKA